MPYLTSEFEFLFRREVYICCRITALGKDPEHFERLSSSDAHYLLKDLSYLGEDRIVANVRRFLAPDFHLFSISSEFDPYDSTPLVDIFPDSQPRYVIYRRRGFTGPSFETARSYPITNLADLASEEIREDIPPLRRPTWVAMTIRGDGGELYSKATINITFPDGRRRRERVTEHSKWRADDVATKGRCIFEIADLGPPEFGEHTTSDISVPLYADGTSEAWTVDTGTSATVVLHKPPVAVIDSGLCFATDRETLLPAWNPDAFGPPYNVLVTGLDALREAFVFARDNPGRRIVVAGHTDATGSCSSNEALSERRANSVYLFLKGDRAAWAKLAHEHAEVEDEQSVLLWASVVMGMQCDPGSIDGDHGPATTDATDRFRDHYAQRFGQNLPTADGFAEADWGAAFDVFKRCIAEQLGISDEDLGSLRSGLEFASEPVWGCGERYPADEEGPDTRPNARRRRVDILFYDPEHAPALDRSPVGSGIYGPDALCARNPLLVVPASDATLRLILRDGTDEPMANADCRITADEASIGCTSNAYGYLEFRVPVQTQRAALQVLDAAGNIVAEYDLCLGQLGSVHEPQDRDKRLCNLGYDTSNAEVLMQFQSEFDLSTTGEADPETCHALICEHGC